MNWFIGGPGGDDIRNLRNGAAADYAGVRGDRFKLGFMSQVVRALELTCNDVEAALNLAEYLRLRQVKIAEESDCPDELIELAAVISKNYLIKTGSGATSAKQYTDEEKLVLCALHVLLGVKSDVARAFRLLSKRSDESIRIMLAKITSIFKK